jgi:signal transduction histidine kinase
VTIGALVVVALALVGLGVGIISLVRDGMVRTVETTALAQARSVGTLAEAGQLPTVLEVDSLDRTVLQVVSADGRVLTSSAQLTGLGPITGSLAVASGESARTIRLVLPGAEPVLYRVATVVTETPSGPVLVHAGSSLADSDSSLTSLTSLMLAGLVAALVVVGAVTWFVVRRALQPVEEIRSEVDQITSTDLGRRVPVPGYGDEVTRLAATMNRMLDRLQGAVEQQRQLVADVSHEVRSPIASLRTQLEVALAHPGLTDWPELAEDLLEDTDRLQGLATDLLLLARLDAGEQVATEPVDLGDLVREVADRSSRGRVHAAEAPAPSTSRPTTPSISLAITDGIVVSGNRSQLARVVGNLLDNARRHAADAIRVTVTTRSAAASPDKAGHTRSGLTRGASSAAYGLVEVCNDGEPIPEKDHERIFERFVRLDDARARDLGGTGLGLPIARQLARAHGGELRVSTDSGATCFVLTVPAL